MSYKEIIEQRILNESIYMIENNATIREVAKKFNVSKTTVHNDFCIKLKNIDFKLYTIVMELLNKNKEERCLRGSIQRWNK